MKIEKKIISYGSEEYLRSVELRDKVLRKPLGLHFTEEFLQQDKGEYILGLFEDDKILACLNLRMVSDTVMRARQVAVDDEYQGKGLGRILVEFSEAFCKERGFREIFLHARDKAIEFYKRTGYKISDPEWFTEVGIRHLKMTKQLT
jgi:N-acetylglutamate synthase-like GNAT family acetyltransferase